MDLTLPLEILYEILSRLPVKTLIRFRCVCVSWNSLISHPTFQRDHYDNSKHGRLLLITKRFSHSNTILRLSTHESSGGTFINFFNITVPLHRSPSCLDICYIQSCKGLVCFTDTFEKHIFVCNPSTREIIALPPTEGDTHFVGLGFAESAKEFKVVRLFNIGGSETMCEIFNLGTGQWKEARCPCPNFREHFGRNAPFGHASPFIHGAIHFLPFHDDPTIDISICAFDIESEESTTIRLPESYYIAMARGNPEWQFRYMKGLGGSLYLIFDYSEKLELWNLKDYTTRDWVKEYIINFSIIGYIIPFAILGDGNLLLDVVSKEPGIYCYNTREGTIANKLPVEYRLAIMYEETLFSPGDNVLELIFPQEIV